MILFLRNKNNDTIVDCEIYPVDADERGNYIKDPYTELSM